MMRAVLLAAILGGCSPQPAPPPSPAQEAPPPPATTKPAPVPTQPPAAASREPNAIAPQPVPAAERLHPCAAVLYHTTYDEETRAPTLVQTVARRLLRVWSDELREREWRDVAPIPLTADQARALLPDPEAYSDAAGGGLFATVGDGTLSYRFDEAGRTSAVGWDPTADSSTYEFLYAYDCVPTIVPPVWAEN